MNIFGNWIRNVESALLPLCTLLSGSPSCLREAEDEEGAFKRAQTDFDESMSTRFEGMSVGDANPDSASASESVATVRSADVGVGTGKGAGDSAAASAPVATVRSTGAGVVGKKPVSSPRSRSPVYKKKSAELRKQGDGVPEDGGKDSKKVYPDG